MLKEIYCPLFKEGKTLRPPILFHKGLNIILGSEQGKAGSIGKSTMLLIIDFVFGGNEYMKSDAVQQLGEHTVYFKFTFDNKDFQFARFTAHADIIAEINEKREIIKTIKLDEFVAWISEKYKMNLPGLKFRNTLSRFFRIYGKNNLNEQRPLQMRGGMESQKDAIHVLVTLFDVYSKILSFEEQLKQVENEINAFKAARKYQFIPSAVDGTKKYEDNVKEISHLEQQRAELRHSAHATVSEADIKETSKRNEQLRQLQDVQRLIRSKEDDLHLLRRNVEQGIYPTEADLKNLSEFFPEANLKKLAEIEVFHNKIQRILKSELKEAATQIEAEIEPLQAKAEALVKEVDSIHPSQVFTDDFLEAYTSFERRIAKLQDENEAFDIRNRLRTNKINANARYQEQMKSILNHIESEINSEMERLSDLVTYGEYNAPKLTINKYDSYNFETPKDAGTGTNNRGMVIYDLSILRKTILPAIAHDSILFDTMARPDLSHLLTVYTKETDKQIFISLDKISTCSNEAQTIIQKATVLKLENNEHALFGEKWSKKEK
jgi:hypothetical protein